MRQKIAFLKLIWFILRYDNKHAKGFFDIFLSLLKDETLGCLDEELEQPIDKMDTNFIEFLIKELEAIEKIEITKEQF